MDSSAASFQLLCVTIRDAVIFAQLHGVWFAKLRAAKGPGERAHAMARFENVLDCLAQVSATLDQRLAAASATLRAAVQANLGALAPFDVRNMVHRGRLLIAALKKSLATPTPTPTLVVGHPRRSPRLALKPSVSASAKSRGKK